MMVRSQNESLVSVQDLTQSELHWTTTTIKTHLKPRWSLSVLVGQRSGVAQEAKHAVHHVRVIHGLLLLPLHLLQQLLLPPRLLLLLPLPLLLLLGQLDQPLLVFPLGLCLGPLYRHLVPQLLLLGEALALGFLPMLQL